ncbi:glyoxylate reductase [Ophiocordyceps camponoti-floridani]|uniref:Glyoxylate reductase n=1 Tax=Ophiocordyceps camponoti-floridani TaxID=2030778 RepID=A0A8H4VBS4_9HYPO|nr:glyoxylate reductase [Ophiocordyceps camponoti-floridani]
MLDGNMARVKVLLLGKIEHALEAWAAIEDIADVLVPTATNREEFLREARVDGEMLEALPGSLRFVCHNGAGYDQVDIAACTAHKILVSNTPTAVDDATADLTIWLLLGTLRNLPTAMSTLRAASWRGATPPALGHDPRGKTLGILGMGGIGRNVAAKARAFGMKVRYHNRKRLDEGLEEGAEYVDFETLLRESDVLSLNLPLNAKTHHAISTPQFAKMKPGITIINTARGAVMDEAALVQALSTGQVASVGLDVYENEPHIHPGLLSNPNVLLVPHMGTWTVETQTKMEEWTMDNVRSVVLGGGLVSVVPEQRGVCF